MKRIVFLISVVITVAILSAYKQFSQDTGSDEKTKQALVKDSRNIKKAAITDSNSNPATSAAGNVTESRPRVLFLLKNEAGIPKWSPSLWWNYTPGQTGC